MEQLQRDHQQLQRDHQQLQREHQRLRSKYRRLHRYWLQLITSITHLYNDTLLQNEEQNWELQSRNLSIQTSPHQVISTPSIWSNSQSYVQSDTNSYVTRYTPLLSRSQTTQTQEEQTVANNGYDHTYQVWNYQNHSSQ